MEKITLNLSKEQMCMLHELVNKSINKDCHRVWKREILDSLKTELEDTYKKPVMTKEELQEQLEIERKYWEERDSDIALGHNMTRAKETELRFEYEITGEEEKICIDDPEEMDPYVSSSKYVSL